MKALLLQLEFPTWKAARPWTYGASFAVAEGLAANGVTASRFRSVLMCHPHLQRHGCLTHAGFWQNSDSTRCGYG